MKEMKRQWTISGFRGLKPQRMVWLRKCREKNFRVLREPMRLKLILKYGQKARCRNRNRKKNYKQKNYSLYFSQGILLRCPQNNTANCIARCTTFVFPKLSFINCLKGSKLSINFSQQFAMNTVFRSITVTSLGEQRNKQTYRFEVTSNRWVLLCESVRTPHYLSQIFILILLLDHNWNREQS